MSQRVKFWLAHLAAVDAGHVAAKAYAGQHGLSVSPWYHWPRWLQQAGSVGKVLGGVGIWPDSDGCLRQRCQPDGVRSSIDVLCSAGAGTRAVDPVAGSTGPFPE